MINKFKTSPVHLPCKTQPKGCFPLLWHLVKVTCWWFSVQEGMSFALQLGAAPAVLCAELAAGSEYIIAT